MRRYPFEIWANSRWDGEPFRIGRYASKLDAEKAMGQWPDMDCWIVEVTEGEQVNAPVH